MKRYLAHIHGKPTHERRQHAVQVATLFTAVIFMGWLGTLGVRLATTPTSSSGETADTSVSSQTQLGSVVTSVPGLEIATTSTSNQ